MKANVISACGETRFPEKNGIVMVPTLNGYNEFEIK